MIEKVFDVHKFTIRPGIYIYQDQPSDELLIEDSSPCILLV